MWHAPRDYQTSSWPTWLAILALAPLIALGAARLLGFPADQGTLRTILLAETALVLCGVAVLVFVDALSPRSRKASAWDMLDDLDAPDGTLAREVAQHQHLWNSRVDGYLRKAWRGVVAEREAAVRAVPDPAESDPFADPRWDEPVGTPLTGAAQLASSQKAASPRQVARDPAIPAAPPARRPPPGSRPRS